MSDGLCSSLDRMNERMNEFHEPSALSTVANIVELAPYSAFTLATSELGQTGLVLFSKVDSSREASTWEVPVVALLSTFKMNEFHEPSALSTVANIVELAP